MACDLSILVIALQLARGLVAVPENPNEPNNHLIHAVCRGCQCMPGATQADQLRCQAGLLEHKEAEAKERAADYKEFQRLAAMCSAPRNRIAGGDTGKRISDAIK